MPIAGLKSVREVSSEDNVHTAESLLKGQPGRKWKTKEAGEKCAYVVLEMDETYQITGIDIGNEHAAFVEVLVGKTSCTREDFTEILITCSFMTPFESKSSTNTNRVRCFNQEALVTTAVSNKWQVLKVICTQPFNKHVQYGLSFIKVHVLENKISKKDSSGKCLVTENLMTRKLPTESTENISQMSVAKLSPFGQGKFKLRENSPDSESESSSALFSRWKLSRNNDGKAAPTIAASIRAASSPAALRRLSDFTSTEKKSLMMTNPVKVGEPNKLKFENVESYALDRNRDHLLFGDDDEEQGNTKNKRLEQQIEVDLERLRVVNENNKKQEKKQKPTPATSKASNASSQYQSITNNENNTKERVQKRHSSPNKKSAKKIKTDCKQYRPFNELLRGTTLAISGIQNPDRADLRQKALALGAKYKADWDSSCTHLICAFKNTPKYNQVNGKGKIVTRIWVEKCYDSKKYLPWRRYALNSLESGKPESDEEILDESLKPKSFHHDKQEEEEKPCVSNAASFNKDATLAMYDLDEAGQSNHRMHSVSSGSDTEDELERIAQKKKPSYSNKENKSNKCADIYEVSTEEEDFLQEKIKSHIKSETFFHNYMFFITSNVSVVDKMKLENYIEKYAGHLTQNLIEAHYAISDKTLDSSQTTYFTGETVRPLWIFECNNTKSKLSTKRYLL